MKTGGLTREQAIEMYANGWWRNMPARDVAMFQLHEDLLCLPIHEFMKALSKALGRPVYTHEIGLNRTGLQQELLGRRPAPTFGQILELLPADRRFVIDPSKKPT